MKKKTIAIIIAVVLIIALVVGGVLIRNNQAQKGKWYVKGDDSIAEMAFEDELTSLDMMDNTWETALPQTEIHRLITEHFAAPLPEGKTEKKAIVIGYDGCRVDNFRLVENTKHGAVKELLDNGGHAVFSYAGGVNYPEENIQDTSTAPGWCSMLTGVWSDVHHITGNGQPKEIEPKTLLLQLVEDGTIDSSAFYVSWDGHFSKKSATYINEKNYIAENGLNAVYLRALNDSGTKANILKDICSEDCSDFIFLTLEYTDHAGHSTGFSLQNPKYVSAFRNADASGVDIVDAIKARPTYDTEDWLILITTDHGGNGRGHGGPSFEERITFIVSNKDILE